MEKVHVTTHREGRITQSYVQVHGTDVTNGGDADPQNNPSFVGFNFTGDGGARLRVEIRGESTILYREEVQLPPGGGTYESHLRYFAVPVGVTGPSAEAQQC